MSMHSQQSLDYPPAPVPDRPSLANMRAAVQECRACELWEGATQAVIGEGKRTARVMLVGEQLEVVKPAALVCLGATAGQALLGAQIRVGRDRGRPLESDLAELVTLTTHPSAILRTDAPEREQAMDEFVADLETVARWLGDK